jgi:hypothetical protein
MTWGSSGSCTYARLREITRGASEELVDHFQVIITAISALFGVFPAVDLTMLLFDREPWGARADLRGGAKIRVQRPPTQEHRDLKILTPHCTTNINPSQYTFRDRITEPGLAIPKYQKSPETDRSLCGNNSSQYHYICGLAKGGSNLRSRQYIKQQQML